MAVPQCGMASAEEIPLYGGSSRCAGATERPESLGNALGLPFRKHKEGKQLIDKFSKPRRDGAFNEPEDFPVEYLSFQQYCRRDVIVEEIAEQRMIPLSDEEEEVFRLGLAINARGLAIDRESAEAALLLAERAKARFDTQMSSVTAGAVRRCSEAGALYRWINSQGVAVDSATKTDLVELLDFDIPSHVKQAIQLRLAAGKTSVSKIKAMLTRASTRDDRVRGGFVYHVASTGRFQSVGVNFANLPRPREIFKKARLDVHPETLFSAIRSGDPAMLELFYGAELGSPMHLLSDAIRSFIQAGPGKKLVVSDYAGIEGAVIAWLADEQWKLAAMREIIADPSKPDMYRRAAASIMGMSTREIDKKHPLRQSVGKVSELALGFGGGVGAFASMARGHGVDLDALYEPVHTRADDLDILAAEKRYKDACSRKEKSTEALSRAAWLACELIKRAWRSANPAIKEMWWNLEAGVREAIKKPGLVVDVDRVRYVVAHNFLFCRLPSGRCLAYAMPRLKAQVWASRFIDGTWAAPEIMEAELAEKLGARVEKQSFPKADGSGCRRQDPSIQAFRPVWRPAGREQYPGGRPRHPGQWHDAGGAERLHRHRLGL